MTTTIIDPAAPIIVGGCPRSGTTLLRLMLDSHPNITCGPEFKAIPMVMNSLQDIIKTLGPSLKRDYGVTGEHLAQAHGRMISELLEPYRVHSGKARIAEKTPQNGLPLPFLVHALPRSPLIQVIRDGRDVAASLVKQDWRSMVDNKPVEYTGSVEKAARYWRRYIENGEMTRKKAPDRYMALFYEDLVADPRKALAPLLDLIGEEWDERMLNYDTLPHDRRPGEKDIHGNAPLSPVYRDSVGRWATEWDADDHKRFDAEAGDLLRKLGYVS